MAAIRRAKGADAGLDRAGLTPPDEALLDQPIDYLLAGHQRQRGICSALRRLAGTRTCTRAAADHIVRFLSEDLPLHQRDRDEDIFPLLLRRALPEDGLACILAQLSEHHRKARRQAARIVEALTARPAADEVAISRQTAALLLSYARNGLRQLAIESCIVLVIARKRLKPSDLQEAARTMRARRGLRA